MTLFSEGYGGGKFMTLVSEGYGGGKSRSNHQVLLREILGSAQYSRKLLRSLAFLATLLASASVSIAQENNNLEPPPWVGFERNSEICGYTFFTDEDDTIDFRGGRLETCFDMRAGDDLLILNRFDYDAGVKVISGFGRDTVWTTNGPDHVIDSDGEDKEIRTYDGDDIIDIRVPVDKDPFRGVDRTQRTNVRPGSGKNQILISKDLYSNAFARVSPNVWLWSEGESVDTVDASCGRPGYGNNYDVRVMQVPDTSHLEIKSMGCGIGIFNFTGSSEVDQVGGRFALSTQVDGFKIEPSSKLPKLSGRVSAGSGAFIDLTRSDPASDFIWEGPEVALVRSHFNRAGSGGIFSLFSDNLVRLELQPSDATALFRLGSRSEVEVSVSAGAIGSERIEMAAPRMDIIWSHRLGSVFPKITNASTLSSERTTMTVPLIEYYEGETIIERASAMINEAMGIESKTEADPDVAEDADIEDPNILNADLPADVSDIEITVENIDFEPGFTRLTIKMRLENDPLGVCISAQIVDLDGIYPTLQGRCVDRMAPLYSVRIDGALEYEELRFSGQDAPDTIQINGETEFIVNRIELNL